MSFNACKCSIHIENGTGCSYVIVDFIAAEYIDYTGFRSIINTTCPYPYIIQTHLPTSQATQSLFQIMNKTYNLFCVDNDSCFNETYNCALSIYDSFTFIRNGTTSCIKSTPICSQHHAHSKVIGDERISNI